MRKEKLEKNTGKRGAERSMPKPVVQQKKVVVLKDQDELDYEKYIDPVYPEEMKLLRIR